MSQPLDNLTTSATSVFVIEGSEVDLFKNVDDVEEKRAQENKRQSSRTWILAFGMLISYVALNTTSAQLTNIAFTDKTLEFNAPYLFVMFKCLFRSLAFPMYLTANTITKMLRGRKLNFRRTWWRCAAVCGEGKITWRLVFVKFFPAMFFNLLVQIGYTLGVANLTTSLASALTPPTVATSYLMAWIFMKQPLLLVKVFFVLVAFSGVSFIVYDRFTVDLTTATIWGICAMLVQDLCLSSYQICFKKAFPKGDLGQVSFAVSGMYVFMVVIYWPVPLILKLTGIEQYNIEDLPYGILTGAWSCTAVSSLVYGYGLVLANGFFMSLSDLLILASNSVIDVLRKIVISEAQIIGTAIISFAFIMMVLPDRLVSIDLKLLMARLQGKSIIKSSPSRLVLDMPGEAEPESLPEPEMRMRSRSSVLKSGVTHTESEADLLEGQDVMNDDSTVTPL